MIEPTESSLLWPLSVVLAPLERRAEGPEMRREILRKSLESVSEFRVVGEHSHVGRLNRVVADIFSDHERHTSGVECECFRTGGFKVEHIVFAGMGSPADCRDQISERCRGHLDDSVLEFGGSTPADAPGVLPEVVPRRVRDAYKLALRPCLVDLCDDR